MIFTAPTPFEEALDSRRVKSILPTDADTAALRALSPDIKRRAMFSARTSYGEYLGKVDSWITGILSPEGLKSGEKLDKAAVRLRMKKALQELGYVPSAEDASTLKDLGSDNRLNLIIDTNVRTAQGYGYFVQGQDQDILDDWPCQELFRAESREVPRGEKRGPHDSVVPDPDNAWEARWQEAGGDIIDGRMIARKDDEVWANLGSLRDDSLGNPYPPFAFNSGMDVKDISWDEAKKLGIIDRDTEVKPTGDLGINEALKASPDIRNADLRSAVAASMRGLAAFDKDGVLRMSE